MNLLFGDVVGEIVALVYKRGIILTLRSEVLKIEIDPSPFPFLGNYVTTQNYILDIKLC